VGTHDVDLLGDHGLDARPEPARAAGGELARQQPAVPGVAGRVHVDEHPGDQGVGRDHLTLVRHREVPDLAAVAEPQVAEDLAYQLVTRDDPADVPVRVHHFRQRTFGAQRIEYRGRIELVGPRPRHLE
jgi:hypothetical protein